jgi:superfamily II DNA/RNA helicase
MSLRYRRTGSSCGLCTRLLGTRPHLSKPGRLCAVRQGPTWRADSTLAEPGSAVSRTRAAQLCCSRYRRVVPGGGCDHTGVSRAHETLHRVGHFPTWTDWSLMSTAIISSPPVRFSDLGVPRVLSATLKRQGIVTAFPIQAAALPDALAGRDVCGKAPTGSGKTLAFGLAILSRLAAKRSAADRRGWRPPSALVLVPTRELAAQIEQAVAPLARVVGVRIAAIYGGVGYSKQLTVLRSGVDVLVACPGRLTDLIDRGSVDLSNVETVVIDEADRMADMGFLPAVRRIVDKTAIARQTLLFSATLDGPVDELIRRYQHDPVRHDVAPTDADRGDVCHYFWRVEPHERVAVTTDAVAAHGPAVVFCRTKRGADRLSERLARSGLASAAIHGDRNQSQRERALLAFRAGRLDALVATDIAARGIHVNAVPLVVHFDPAADVTDYVHRSGRTGRAGADGSVVSLVGKEHLGATRILQRKLGLSDGVSSPDVLSLALSRGAHSAGPRPDVARGGTVPTGTDGGAVVPTEVGKRPSRRRRRRAPKH